jgi:hypothetical protein
MMQLCQYTKRKSDAFTATYEDGIITFEVQKDFAIPDTGDVHNDYYDEALVFKVTAKDGNLFSETTEEITVRGNKKPDVVDGFTGLNDLAVGTQDAFASDASDDDKKDPCNKLNTVCVAVQEAFSDNGHDEDNLAAGFAKLTYHSTSKAGVLEAMTTADAMLKLVGIGKPVNAAGEYSPEVELVINAIDAGDLKSDNKAYSVTVDPAPEKKGRLNGGSQLTLKAGTEHTISNIASFFSNDGPNTETISVTVGNIKISPSESVSPDYVDFEIEQGNLVITAKNVSDGAVTITVVAVEGGAAPVQSAEQELKVVVVAP